MSQDQQQSQQVGVIGLGAMGMGTATALLSKGFQVTGCDIASGAREVFSAAGGNSVATPAELAHCDVVLVIVVNGQQAEEVLFGAQGWMRPLVVALPRPKAVIYRSWPLASQKCLTKRSGY